MILYERVVSFLEELKPNNIVKWLCSVMVAPYSVQVYAKPSLLKRHLNL